MISSLLRYWYPISNSKTLGSNNKNWVQPPQYLALCGASSKGLMHLVLTLGICTTTTTKLTCKKYRTGIHKFPKATYQPQDFLFSAALLTTTTSTIFKNILYASFAWWLKRLMDVCKGNFFLRRLPETGNSWASFVLFCFFSVGTSAYIFARWMLKNCYIHYIHPSIISPVGVLY